MQTPTGKICLLRAPVPMEGSLGNTQLKVYSGDNSKISFDGCNPLATFRVRTSDGKVLQSNFGNYWGSFMAMSNKKYFLINHEDVQKITRATRNSVRPDEVQAAWTENLSSMTKFTEKFSKQLYVRVLPPLTEKSDQMCRVFAEEVLEVLCILLRQETPILSENIKGRLHALNDAWSSKTAECHTTIDMEQLEQVLDEFGINRSFLVLIQDPVLVITEYIYFQNGGHIVTYSPNMEVVADPFKSLNYVFMKLVLGINWRMTACSNEEYALNMKNNILELMKSVENIDEHCYLSSDALMVNVTKVRTMRPATYPNPGNPHCYLFKQFPPHLQFKTWNYEQIVKLYDLQKYQNFISTSIDKFIPVWMARFFVTVGWLEQFFCKPSDKVHQIKMIENLFLFVPKSEHVAARTFLEIVISKSDVFSKPDSSSEFKSESRKEQNDEKQYEQMET
ncbi:hypothetical protein L3Y34_010374 [Caenorhabditis briggsae]|uniref:Uncharacterized protein n=1 Tax=Caenorhabditis briggsae TaxID=6238 RepID=A0AAE8ZM76_CAEBR|nr:hypothetical protein L3Y34_010374 [Caenorhabditis briggsae]